MTKQLEKFILKSRLWCEFPNPEGGPRCPYPATRVIEVKSPPSTHYVAVCNDCAQYAAEEINHRKEVTHD